MAETKVTSSEISSVPTRRQNNTSNTSPNGARIETGWGWMQNTTGSSQQQLSESVTFGQAFTDLPIVLVTYGGDAGNVAASYGTGGGVNFGAAMMKASNITASNFTVTMTSSTALPNTHTIYYQWIAIGV